ncbi:MAG: hypothetical protein ACW98K_15035 [Candidatus Kariarchaeaceae archaeon]|jgi:hypothetical protein
MATSTSSTSSPRSGGYRLKFQREDFIKLLGIAKPDRLYRVKNFFYFNFDGFVMYCDECSDMDVSAYPILDAIEFSNYPWSKK